MLEFNGMPYEAYEKAMREIHLLTPGIRGVRFPALQSGSLTGPVYHERW
jgi:hypothetical protein